MMNRYNKTRVSISINERNQLNSMLRKGKYSVWVIKRAQILLALHKKYVVVQIAKFIGVSAKTVYNIAQAYHKGGLDYALFDLPRSGRSPVLNEKQDAHIVALACSNPPPGRARWTVQLLVETAEKMKIVMKIGWETVRKLLKTHALRPWREKMWCVAKLDDEYISKMEDVLAVYEKTYDKRHPVVCIDEKPVQLLSEPYRVIPAREHQIKRRDHEYKREGVANVFCAVEPKSGNVTILPTPNRKADAFAKFLRLVLSKYPLAKKIHVVMDNLNTHLEKSLIKKYGEKIGKALWNRIAVHYTPKHASWLNQAEIAIGIYSRQCLGKDRVKDLTTLRNKTNLWKRRGAKIKIDWRFTRKKARNKFNYKQ